MDWLLTVAHFVRQAPLGKQRSRDPKDDPRYLVCALAAGAEAIVTSDRDLLSPSQIISLKCWALPASLTD